MRYLIPALLLAVFAAPVADAKEQSGKHRKADRAKVERLKPAKPAARKAPQLPAAGARKVPGTQAQPFALPDMRGRKTDVQGLFPSRNIVPGASQGQQGTQQQAQSGGIKIGKSRLNIGLGNGGLRISVTGPKGNSTTVVVGVESKDASTPGGDGTNGGNTGSNDNDQEGGENNDNDGGNDSGNDGGNSNS